MSRAGDILNTIGVLEQEGTIYNMVIPGYRTPFVVRGLKKEKGTLGPFYGVDGDYVRGGSTIARGITDLNTSMILGTALAQFLGKKDILAVNTKIAKKYPNKATKDKFWNNVHGVSVSVGKAQ